jgi:hypothetical protein
MQLYSNLIRKILFRLPQLCALLFNSFVCIDKLHKFLFVKLNYLLGNLIIASLKNKNQPKIDLAGILNLIDVSNYFSITL